ncbi:hypothetical protein K8I61_18785, partial [bacterium]|nr:hypothetical protein [bacterium]
MDKMDIMDKMDMMQPAPARRAKTLRSTAIALALTLVVFHSACREKKDFFTADETWFPGEATPAPTPAAETVPRDVPSIARVLESPSESRRADA